MNIKIHPCNFNEDLELEINEKNFSFVRLVEKGSLVDEWIECEGLKNGLCTKEQSIHNSKCNFGRESFSDREFERIKKYFKRIENAKGNQNLTKFMQESKNKIAIGGDKQ